MNILGFDQYMEPRSVAKPSVTKTDKTQVETEADANTDIEVEIYILASIFFILVST